jgi:hypothetical protein
MSPSNAGRPPRVHIITWCQAEEQLYGSLLIFKTLRVGFPTAPVVVIDNVSRPEFRPVIRRAARDAGCKYIQLTEAGASHADLLGEILGDADGTDRDDPLVFVDPDVMFWECCENWTFGDAMIAGRLIPPFEETPGFLCLPRLHTSFLWIPDPPFVRLVLGHLTRAYVGPTCMPFSDYTFKIGAQWLHFDVGVGLYSWLADYAYIFGPRELDAYDHLFLGTHLCVDALTEDFLSSPTGERMRALVETHRIAQEDYRRLRGLWRQQEQWFQSRAWDFQALAAAVRNTTPARSADRDQTETR